MTTETMKIDVLSAMDSSIYALRNADLQLDASNLEMAMAAVAKLIVAAEFACDSFESLGYGLNVDSLRDAIANAEGK